MEGFLGEHETDIVKQKAKEAEYRRKMISEGYVRILVLDESNDLTHQWIKLDDESRKAMDDAKKRRQLENRMANLHAREERLKLHAKYAELEKREKELAEREKALEASIGTQGSKPKARS